MPCTTAFGSPLDSHLLTDTLQEDHTRGGSTVAVGPSVFFGQMSGPIDVGCKHLIEMLTQGTFHGGKGFEVHDLVVTPEFRREPGSQRAREVRGRVMAQSRREEHQGRGRHRLATRASR